MLCKEGHSYRFTHRSFQEYFTAWFLKEQLDEDMEKRSLQITKEDPGRAHSDSMFSMLYAMAGDRFENNIMLPIIKELECDFSQREKFDFYIYLLVEPFTMGDFDINEELSDFLFLLRFRYYEDMESILIANESEKQSCVSFMTSLRERLEEKIAPKPNEEDDFFD